MTKKALFSLIFSVIFLSISAQKTDMMGNPIIKYSKKLDRKITLSPFIGAAYIPATSSLDQYGRTSNIYAGFNPAVHFGFGMYYPMPFYPRLMANAEMSNFVSVRRYNIFGVTSFNLGAKFLFRDRRKKLNPYVAAGLGMPNVFFHQIRHNEVITPDPSTTDIDFGDPTKFEKRIPEKTIIMPQFSPYIALGLQYKIDRKYGVFLQAGYSPIIGNDSRTAQISENHNADLQYFVARAGVNIQLMKPKPPYVDTAMIPIPDPIIAFAMPEDFMSQRMLVREGVFDVILREGMKHTVRLEVGSHELVIEEEPQDPCKVACYLQNEKGEVIARAESQPSGKIVFTDIDKGIYDVTFVLQKPCTEANFKYKFPDPSLHPELQYNSDGVFSDSMVYNIEGKVEMPDTADFNFVYKSSSLFLASLEKRINTNFDLKVMLCDSAAKVLQTYEPEKDFKFHFDKLKKFNFDVIYKVPDAEMKSTLSYAFIDNYRFAARKFYYTDKRDSLSILLSAEDVFYNKLKFNLKGKVKLLDTLITQNGVTLYLVNENKKIVFLKKPEKDGSFVFKNLKSKVDYKIYYELDNPKSKISIGYKQEELVPLPKANLDDIDVIGRRKRLVPDLPTPVEGNLAYTPTGGLANPKGYGIFVGAFENINNVDLLCKKLIRDGYKDIAIVVGMTDKMNDKFKFTRSFKIHKVYVGQYNKERHAKRIEERLQDLGYETFLGRYDTKWVEKPEKVKK